MPNWLKSVLLIAVLPTGFWLAVALLVAWVMGWQLDVWWTGGLSLGSLAFLICLRAICVEGGAPDRTATEPIAPQIPDRRTSTLTATSRNDDAVPS